MRIYISWNINHHRGEPEKGKRILICIMPDSSAFEKKNMKKGRLETMMNIAGTTAQGLARSIAYIPVTNRPDIWRNRPGDLVCREPHVLSRQTQDRMRREVKGQNCNQI